MAKRILRHGDLDVYQKAFDAAMEIFELSRGFPKEETYSLTDQMRRSSRSVCANIAEAWRKRRYEKSFISKLSDAESEAAETQVWLAFAVRCGYMPREEATKLYRLYDEILRISPYAVEGFGEAKPPQDFSFPHAAGRSPAA